MKIASFADLGAHSYGIVEGDTVFDCGAALRNLYPDLKAVVAADALDALADEKSRAPRLKLADLAMLPVIARPDKILCVGVNYEDHRKETGRSASEKPVIFTRFFNTQTGHGTDLQMPHVSSNFDFEGEMAVIIGKPGRYISAASALSHVAGFSIYNDATLRDWQAHTPQFTPGKNFVGTGGFGPWMVTPDEMGPLGAQRLQTRLNGQVVQEATLSDMIFDVPHIIAYISSFTRLEPGDVIATGTPGGVGAKRTPPLWMKIGDTVEITIDGIGTLRNGVGVERLE